MPVLIWNGRKTHRINSYQPFDQKREHWSNQTLTLHSYEPQFFMLHSLNNTSFSHKVESIYGKETCTQIILTLNGEQYAPKYVKVKVNWTWYTANIADLRATSKVVYTFNFPARNSPQTNPTLVWVLLGVSHHLTVMRSGGSSTSPQGQHNILSSHIGLVTFLPLGLVRLWFTETLPPTSPPLAWFGYWTWFTFIAALHTNHYATGHNYSCEINILLFQIHTQSITI